MIDDDVDDVDSEVVVDADDDTSEELEEIVDESDETLEELDETLSDVVSDVTCEELGELSAVVNDIDCESLEKLEDAVIEDDWLELDTTAVKLLYMVKREDPPHCTVSKLSIPSHVPATYDLKRISLAQHGARALYRNITSS